MSEKRNGNIYARRTKYFGITVVHWHDLLTKEWSSVQDRFSACDIKTVCLTINHFGRVNSLMREGQRTQSISRKCLKLGAFMRLLENFLPKNPGKFRNQYLLKQFPWVQTQLVGTNNLTNATTWELTKKQKRSLVNPYYQKRLTTELLMGLIWLNFQNNMRISNKFSLKQKAINCI